MRERRTRQNRHNGDGKYFLQPGYMYFSDKPVLISTVVGSCVSVCLWDSKLHTGAINHFLYARARDEGKATPCYGDAATTALVRMMLENGSERGSLIAQIFGGANPGGVKGGSLEFENVAVAREILTKKGIAISSQDVGGRLGRKIVFDTETGHVAVLKVHKLRADDWLQTMDSSVATKAGSQTQREKVEADYQEGNI